MREQRLVFGEDAELYDRARPSYPPALVRDVLRLPAERPHFMVDAGCGTGKASVLFAAAGVAGIGVEAHPAMAAVAQRHLDGHDWRIDVSGFEAWMPRRDDPPVDLLVSAQAWHWFDPDARFRQAFRILRPGGWLGVWWNHAAPVLDPVRRAIDAVYAAMAPEMPEHSCARAAEVKQDHPGIIPDNLAFGEPVRRAYSWSRTYTAGQWVDYLRTQSNHRMLSDERREALLAEVGRAIESHGGRHRQRYSCDLWAAERLGR